MSENEKCQGLTYGEVDGKLIFLPSETASGLSTLWAVLKSANTWRDLEKRLPDHRVEEIRERYMGDEPLGSGNKNL